MQHNPIKDFLVKLGLDTKEIRAYLYCLKHGPQLFSRLAQVTGTTRTNTYDIIKKLEKRGLCHTIGSTYGRKVRATEPVDIREVLENKTKEIKDLGKELDELLPIFKTESAHLLSPITRVSYFEGVDSVRKMLWQSLQAKSKIIKIAGSELDMVESLGKEYVSDYHIRRSTKGIHLQALRPDSKRIPGDVFTNDTKYLRELRIRPKGEIRLKSNLIIWDHYVALYSLKNNVVFGTLIESEEMAVMLGTWFDFIWDKSKSPSFVKPVLRTTPANTLNTS